MDVTVEELTEQQEVATLDDVLEISSHLGRYVSVIVSPWELMRTRLLIFPTRLLSLSFLSSPSSLALAFPFALLDDATLAELGWSVCSVPSAECSPSVPTAVSASEAVSGVGATEGEGVDAAVSAFIRMRRECSKTSCVMIACARTNEPVVMKMYHCITIVPTKGPIAESVS